MALNHIWLIPLLPAFGAAIMFFFGRSATKAWVNTVCVGVVVAAFLLSVAAVSGLVTSGQHSFEQNIYTWLGDDTGRLSFTTLGGAPAAFKIQVGFLLDPLSSIWLLFVTGVGLLIHIYSTGYMAHEGGYYRFFGYLNLFMFSMLTLILANNYVLMFVGWEGVGLCSYLLIGFYFHKHSASTAANKAFIVNRVGDAGVILGTFAVMWLFGTVNFREVTELANANAASLLGSPLVTAATIALFVGACGKSAQLPLYVWLPDAMEGPTPVSALIHAATMVTAGVYMVARSSALFVLSPKAMAVVAVVGALTAIFAASIGLVQNDIKRVLAYSTVSQLGYMFLALGVGAFAAGVFHVFTHAFFKALLFLGSGSVIHAMSGEQDMRNMGGLRKHIPTTFATMFIGTLAIAGFPGLAGFFSKDEILWQTWSSHNGAFRALWFLAYPTALMTAFYMFRLIYLTFYGEKPMSLEVEHHLHESPKSMTVPLVILAIGSIFAGYLGMPAAVGKYVGVTNRFERVLEPVFEHRAAVAQVGTETEVTTHGGEAAAAVPHDEPSSAAEYGLMGLSIAACFIGWFAANRAYGKAGKDYVEPIQAAAPPIYRTLLNKYWVDELYDYLFTGRRKLGPVRLGAQGLGDALWKFDANVIDGGVNGTAWLTRLISSVSSWWDKWVIDGVGVNGPAYVTRALSLPVRFVQWGLMQWYALVMIIGVVGFVFYYLR